MLERLQVAVRLRGNWEALDLGACLLRRYGREVYAVWLPVVGGLAVALALLLHRWPWLAALAFWWLKPCCDRLVLHVLGRAAFGEAPTLGRTLRELPLIFRRGAAAGLLWRRLSPQRSYVLPVWQLEDQRGAGFRGRARPLLKRGRFTAQALTLVCLHCEWIVQLGLLVAIQLLVPRGSDFNVFSALFAGDGTTPAWLGGVAALLPFLAATAIEPWYVAAGFGLYLNRRVQLEGWDLELAFRSLASRLARSAALVMLLASVPLAAQPASAQARIEAVLQAPEFQTTRMERGLRWKPRKAPRPEAARGPGFAAFLKLLATLLKVLFIAAAAAMVLWFLWRVRGLFGWGRRAAPGLEPPASLFGLDLRPESLPRDVAAAARALFAAGRAREALALLYRASLSRLVGAHDLQVPRGATEGDCLRLAARLLSAEAGQCFCELTGAWQAAAYAHRPPEDGEALCRRWSSAFAEPR